MRLLLDTHVLLWWLGDDAQLSSRASELIEDRTNHVFLSALSLWEIAIKSRLRRLEADVEETRLAAQQSGFEPLPFTPEHAVVVARLPGHHRDPFDRGLIAQALADDLTLVTHDQVLAPYGERVLII